ADRLRDHGITPVSYGEGVRDRIQEATGGRIDAFIDAVGADSVSTALSLGVSPERINTVVDYAAARLQGVRALGTMEAGGTSSLRELAALAAAGQLTVPIASTYELAQVQAAYRELVDARPCGRVVLHPQE
ncbi:MAG: NADP-dependent oxidoreductase, partial [Propionibacteriaceae bacterium]